MAHEGQHQSPLELITQNVRGILADVLNKLECGDVDRSIDFARYRVEWLCSVLVRLGGSLEENLLPLLQEAQQLLAILDRDDYFNCTSYAPVQKEVDRPTRLLQFVAFVHLPFSFRSLDLFVASLLFRQGTSFFFVIRRK